MCTIDYEYIHVYIIFEHLIYVTPRPSGLYATLYTKILEEMQKKRKRSLEQFQAPFPEL